jgi:hypothetical protein
MHKEEDLVQYSNYLGPRTACQAFMPRHGSGDCYWALLLNSCSYISHPGSQNLSLDPLIGVRRGKEQHVRTEYTCLAKNRDITWKKHSSVWIDRDGWACKGLRLPAVQAENLDLINSLLLILIRAKCNPIIQVFGTLSTTDDWSIDGKSASLNTQGQRFCLRQATFSIQIHLFSPVPTIKSMTVECVRNPDRNKNLLPTKRR